MFTRVVEMTSKPGKSQDLADTFASGFLLSAVLGFKKELVG